MSFDTNAENNNIIQINNLEIIFPERTAKLLYFSDEDPRNVNFGHFVRISVNLIDGKVKSESVPSYDPSTIFLKMPIQRPKNIDDIPRPSYYPTYAGLTPNQKWVYLNWLKDITQPINIGYVFIYYYGLERHLLIGNYDLAFEEILLLRNHHNNDSFILYSTNALRYSSLYKKDPNRLKQLYNSRNPDRFDNFDLLIAHQLGYDLPSNVIIGISTNIKGINKRYIKSNPDLYNEYINEYLTRKFGGNYFPFSGKYPISDLPKRQEILFANISFPSNIRFLEIPNFFEYKPFIIDVTELFAEVHELTKRELHRLRSSQ